ncbi:MAG TPA: ABC transporter permease, partial [Actinomycetaceae bacterium]|nr:ABC transporter permease [Actinomycetaceae bacterium]
VLIGGWLMLPASTSIYWPPLTVIIEAFLDWAASGSLWSDIAFSLGNYGVGLVGAITVGVAVGLLIGMSPKVAEVLSPYLDFVRTLPFVVFVPILILALGVGRGPKIFLIFLACVWPILLNTMEGVRSIATGIFDVAHAYRIPLALRIRKVIIPGALPQIAVGVRLAVTIGIVMLVVSEMYGSIEGIGYFVLRSGQRFQLPPTWAGTILIGIIGWLLTVIYGIGERRLLRWTRQDDGATKKRQVGRPKQ